MYMLCVNRIKSFHEKNSRDASILQALVTGNTCICFSQVSPYHYKTPVYQEPSNQQYFLQGFSSILWVLILCFHKCIGCCLPPCNLWDQILNLSSSLRESIH